MPARRIALFVLSWALFGFAQRAAGEDEFIVYGREHDAAGIVVRLAWDGEQPDGPVIVQSNGGSTFIASIDYGQLVTVVPYLPADTNARFTLVHKKRTRQPQVSVSTGDNDATLDVSIGRELWARYHHAQDQRKPYVWPLNSAGEVELTRGYPMGPRIRSIDHEHHQSFWTAHGDVNGADFWEYNEHTGWQETDSIAWGGAGARAWIRAENIWVDAQRKPQLREARIYRFYATDDDRRFFDLDVTLTAAFGAVHFGDTKEGGLLAYRIHDALRERGGSGRISNSEGGVGANECWGKPARWVHYQGKMDRHGTRGILAMDHPESFRHPSYWHARDYGLVAANPFGHSDFTDGELNGDFELSEGESITFRYRVILHAGALSSEEAEAHYAGFANPPEAAWVR